MQVKKPSTDRYGQRTSSTYTRSGGRERGGGGGDSLSSSTYTKKTIRTVIENGRRVTIHSLEKDGEKIEEKYVGTELVGRTINGVAEQIGRIDL